MYHTKKIAYFISHIYGDYQMKLTAGISAKAHEYGYPLEIYTTNDGEDLGDYAIGEESILKIPNFDDIAGILFASGTYLDRNLKEKITDFFKAHPEIPVVEIGESKPSFLSVSMDNNKAAGDLTAHVISTHKARKVCFLGNINQPFYSGKREAAYKQAMADYNIPTDDSLIYSYDESMDDCDKALSYFCQGGKPDAIICYNDEDALTMMECVLKNGYRIPQDIIITGCDDSEGGQNITPSLTTVSFPLDELGSEAVSILVSLINGSASKDYVLEAKPIYRESCGCQPNSHINSFDYLRNRSKKIKHLEKSMFLSMKMSTALSHAKDIDEGCDLIADFINKIEKLNEFYLCLYHDWNIISDQDYEFLQMDIPESSEENSVLLKLGIKNGKRIPECTFVKRAILPDFVSPDENKTFLIFPLFFENRALGYIAMSFEQGVVRFPFNLIEWLTNIAQFLQNICDEERTALMARHLEEIYLKDSLTGLKNRHSFNKAINSTSFAGRYTSIVMIDLDKLKYINDNFGHEEGDFALRTIGQALLSIAGDNDICARFGGDEFYCLLVHEKSDYVDDFIAHVNKYLANFNNLSTKPYKISASIGYETVKNFNADDMSEYLKSADLRMYEIKKSRKE